MKIDKNSWYARMYQQKYGMGMFAPNPLPTDGCLFWKRVLLTIMLRLIGFACIFLFIETAGFAVAKEVFKIQSDTLCIIWGIPLLVVYMVILCSVLAAVGGIWRGFTWLVEKATGYRDAEPDREIGKKVGKFKELYLAVKNRYCPTIEWVDSEEKTADK